MSKFNNFLPKAVGCVVTLLVVAFITLGQAITAGAAPAPTNVNVINPASTPVSVREVGPAIEPFQASAGGSFYNGVDSQTFVLATVPPGKRLVIEYATVSGFLGEAGLKLGALISTTAGGTNVQHSLPVTEQGSINDPVSFAAAQPMRLYADPGTNVVGIVFRTPSQFGGGGGMTISGYYVDLP